MNTFLTIYYNDGKIEKHIINEFNFVEDKIIFNDNRGLHFIPLNLINRFKIST